MPPGAKRPRPQYLWRAALVVFAAMSIAAYVDLVWAVAVAFIALHVLHNLWRPVLISRYDSHSELSRGATVLSIEGQARRVATMVLAPLIGLVVDAVIAHGPGGGYWPLGAVGVVAAAVFVLAPRVRVHSR